jgi:transaldolase
MKKNLSGNLDIYLDGPTFDEISLFENACDGYTFNPSLFRSLGVVDYGLHCAQLCDRIKDRPISLEVIADDQNGMIRQAKFISALGDNVWVKIPITFCDGSTTKYVLQELNESGIKTNITAVFSLDQIRNISKFINKDKTIISIFSGRLYDLGLDAFEIVNNIVKWNSENLGAKILWASPRMVYDIVNANKSGCDIITMSGSMLSKTSLWGKSPEDYSCETVKTFFKDASACGYKL